MAFNPQPDVNDLITIEPFEGELDTMAVIVMLATLLDTSQISTTLLTQALSAAARNKGATAFVAMDMAGSLIMARQVLEPLCRTKDLTQEDLEKEPVYAFTSHDSDIIETGTAKQLAWLFEGKTEPPAHPRLRVVKNAEVLKRYRRAATTLLSLNEELIATSEPVVPEEQ